MIGSARGRVTAPSFTTSSPACRSSSSDPRVRAIRRGVGLKPDHAQLCGCALASSRVARRRSAGRGGRCCAAVGSPPTSAAACPGEALTRTARQVMRGGIRPNVRSSRTRTGCPRPESLAGSAGPARVSGVEHLPIVRGRELAPPTWPRERSRSAPSSVDEAGPPRYAAGPCAVGASATGGLRWGFVPPAEIRGDSSHRSPDGHSNCVSNGAGGANCGYSVELSGQARQTVHRPSTGCAPCASVSGAAGKKVGFTGNTTCGPSTASYLYMMRLDRWRSEFVHDP